MYFCIWKQSGKKSALLWTGMYQLFFCVFNTLSFAILKSSAMPWEKSKCQNWKATVCTWYSSCN